MQSTNATATITVFSLSLIESSYGYISAQISGKNVIKLFRNESGGHRWQRVPPTERNGRRHTSTITVAVLVQPSNTDLIIDENKIEISTTRGSGPGGQNRNKLETCVIAKYNGVTVRCESERSQHQNKIYAIALLKAKLFEQQQNTIHSNLNSDRKNKIGSGMRGDKIRTIRVFDNQVKDHKTNKSISYEKYEKGFLDGLY